MVSWVSLTGLMLVAAMLLCSEPGGAVAGRSGGGGVRGGRGGGDGGRGGRLGRQRTHQKKGKKVRTGKKTNTDVGSKAQQVQGKFNHCDYIDLVEVGCRADSDCAAGGKFLFKAMRGVRRQFLMTRDTNIAVFLEKGKKFTACNDQFNDITASVKCKAMDGVMQMKITRKTSGTCRQESATTAAAAVAAAATPAPMTGDTVPVTCKCPEVRNFICTTEIVSTANMHTITCNKMTDVPIKCGSDLVGTKILIEGLLTIEQHNHKLCSSNMYTAILSDYEWKCKDPAMALAASSACPGDPDTTAADTADTTVAAAAAAAADTTVAVAAAAADTTVAAAAAAADTTVVAAAAAADTTTAGGR